MFRKNSELLNTANCFCKKLHISLGSEYVSDFPEAFSIIIN